MNPIDAILQSIVYAGLLSAIVLGALAVARRRASWMIASSVSALVGSIPLLLGGIGVIGIALAMILLGVARFMTGYHEVRWWARTFAALSLLAALAVEARGTLLGNRASAVDWILIALAGGMFLITIVPAKAQGKPAMSRS